VFYTKVLEDFGESLNSRVMDFKDLWIVCWIDGVVGAFWEWSGGLDYNFIFIKAKNFEFLARIQMEFCI